MRTPEKIAPNARQRCAQHCPYLAALAVRQEDLIDAEDRCWRAAASNDPGDVLLHDLPLTSILRRINLANPQNISDQLADVLLELPAKLTDNLEEAEEAAHFCPPNGPDTLEDIDGRVIWSSCNTRMA